ncbi:polysaccharide lyase family 8 protein [Rhizoctonia solani 123E]|uniref:Polysaccharide lyase family 8 protein n=1 Tax=Rhizoctonia solani 123E TaxID=1423351 RepID=A0A074RQN4_9AGAM|nr:polysaccharide lyase family 8 protein [Rhizoctonia solani 123E]
MVLRGGCFLPSVRFDSGHRRSFLLRSFLFQMRFIPSVTSVTVSLLILLSRATIARADDVDTVYNRQVDYIIRTTFTSQSEIAGYIANIRQDGSWSEVNYSAGCDAQRSSWPAADHWSRILKMAAAYKGKVIEYKDKPELLSALRLAMGYWFANDYSTIGDGSCMDRDFLPGNNCPCGTPGLWGPNWFSNVIIVPTRSGKTCTLLRSELVASELANCTLITSRAYAPFYRNPQPGYISGANIIDMAVIGISAGLLENDRAGNATRIADAYGRVHDEVTVRPDDRVDGIKPDGSFQQHSGIIYNGNYGKDFSNSLIELELQALGTQFQASKSVQDMFGFHLAGSRWTTFTNILRKVVHWDFSVIGRFIAYPTADTSRASAGLQIALDQVRELGNAWNQRDLIDFGNSLTGANDNTANSGKLTGSRMFWNSDYMVHRTEQTVTTVKMLSTRTATGECTNAESPYGFHLSDGVVYTYSTGAEYEDMFAALDYNIPPGITTDYGATPLDCSTARREGADAYAGGVQAGDVGMAAMRYINPFSRQFSFYKAWFFFPGNVQHVLVSNIQQSNAGSSSPVFSVLDQRLRSGDVYVNHSPSQSGNYTEAKSLWHAGTGYAFPTDSLRAVQVSVSLESRTGDWSKIGTSKVPPSSKDLFAAWIPHKKMGGGSDTGQGRYTPIEYSVFPATSSVSDFEDKVSRVRPRTVVNTETASAAIDSGAKILGVAFWKAAGGSVMVNDMGIQVEVDRAVVLMLKFNDESRTKGTVSVADPTHGAGRVNIKVTWNQSKRRGHRRMEGCIGHYCSPVGPSVAVGNREASVSLDLPGGGMAGSTITSAFERAG